MTQLDKAKARLRLAQILFEETESVERCEDEINRAVRFCSLSRALSSASLLHFIPSKLEDPPRLTIRLFSIQITAVETVSLLVFIHTVCAILNRSAFSFRI